MTTPFLSLPGAVAAGDAHTLTVPSHYGSPIAEQRALEKGEAVVDLSDYGVVTVSGPDRLSWLNSMTSQLLLGLRPGESTETLLLDPNGRIEHAMRVVDDGDTTWLIVDPGEAEAMSAYLLRMRFAMRVEVSDESDSLAVALAWAGGSALAALRDLQPRVEWEDPWSHVSAGGVQYSRGEHAGAGWAAHYCVVAREQLPTLVDRVRSGEIAAAGTLALDALEVRAWRPSRSRDVDARSIPHEFDWLRTAVHLNKGCYRGQETIAKVHNLGHPPRRLVLLHLDGSDGELPSSGALIFRAGEADASDARPVGRVTRAALHHEWGGIALALLKRTVPEDAPLEVRIGDSGVAAAAQETIVPSDAGATREIPRLGRLGPR